jgi:hypothetical protein
VAEVARLGLVVDADGAVKQIRLTSSELAKLADQSVKTGASLKQVATPQTEQHINRTAQAIQRVNTVSAVSGTHGLGRLQNAMMGVSVAAAGLPGPLGRVASALGMFTVGGGITVAIIAGIAAIAFAFKKLTADTNAALTKFQEFSGFSRNALQARLGALQGREANLAAGREASGLGYGDRGFDVSLTASIRRNKELERTRELIGQISVALNKIDRDTASADGSSRTGAGLVGLDMDALGPGLKEVARQLADAAVEAERFRKAFADPVTGAFSIPQSDLDAIAAGVKKTADALGDAAEKAKRMKDALRGMFIGAGAGLLDRVLPGAGGVVTGAMSGFAAAGPMGAAIGGGMALVDMLFGMAESAKQAREQFRLWQVQMDDFIASEKEALGIISSLDAATGRVTRQYGEQRLAIERAIAGLDAMNKVADGAFFSQERQNQIDALKKQLDEINSLEGKRVDQLKREQAELEKLAEIERLDDAIGKVQGRIASFVTTIGALSDFRNALKLSDAGSPTDRLAEARRQYEATLSKAKGFTIPGLDGTSDVIVPGDEDAARRLPAIAQTLLELSRLVNASGTGFQSDFLKVMQDTEGLINVFTGLKTIEEQMLAELQLIRTATEKGVQITEELTKPVGQLPTVGGGTSGSTAGGSGSGTGSGTEVTTVLQSGFEELIARVDALASAVDASARETRRAVTALT